MKEGIEQLVVHRVGVVLDWISPKIKIQQRPEIPPSLDHGLLGLLGLCGLLGLRPREGREDGVRLCQANADDEDE